jgi:hypothetical protein
MNWEALFGRSGRSAEVRTTLLRSDDPVVASRHKLSIGKLGPQRCDLQTAGGDETLLRLG